MDHIFTLIKSAQDGNKEAKETIIKENSGLIWAIVRRFQGRGDPEDLYQIGAIGLLKCIEKFDVSYGVKFSTYAVPMIMGEIRRYLRDDGIIKVSRNLKELSYRARKEQEYFLQSENREITIKELADRLSVSSEELLLAMESANDVSSINAGRFHDENGKEKTADIINKKDSEIMIENIILKEALFHLEKKEKQLIILRFYQDRTQADTAMKMGVSQVQVSRLEKKILKKIRSYLE